MPKLLDPEKYFWSKVRKTSTCWVWLGGKNRDGYGIIGKDWRKVGAHRVAYEMQNGPIPEGLHVLHHCDNPPCVRGDHLWVGTHLDNLRDMDRKKRRAPCYFGLNPLARKVSSGEANGSAKVSWQIVEDIRNRYERGEIKASLARCFGLGWSQIDRIVRGEHWKTGGELNELRRNSTGVEKTAASD